MICNYLQAQLGDIVAHMITLTLASFVTDRVQIVPATGLSLQKYD